MHPSLPQVVPSAVVQVAALLAVGAIGATALDAAGHPGPRAIRPATIELAHPAIAPLDMPRPPAVVAAHPAATAAHSAASARKPTVVRRTVAVHHTAAKKWLPTGTGMWIYEWGKTDHGRASTVVARSRSVGLTTLFVRTGSSHDGFTGTKVLNALLPATSHTPVHVVAWDFPELVHPVADARRLARAGWYGRSHGRHVAAVAPDIETPAEGTLTSAKRVQTYLRTLRRLLPKNVAILTTVPWPSNERRGRYPYSTVARYSDALLPMAYWYNNAPQLVTARSVAYLKRFGKPVQPVGQGYDGKIDVPSLPHNNLRKQVPAFLATARQLRVSAVSVWSWQSAPKVTWMALAHARRWFPASH
jgi:hypothetical protein